MLDNRIIHLRRFFIRQQYCLEIPNIFNIKKCVETQIPGRFVIFDYEDEKLEYVAYTCAMKMKNYNTFCTRVQIIFPLTWYGI